MRAKRSSTRWRRAENVTYLLSSQVFQTMKVLEQALEEDFTSSYRIRSKLAEIARIAQELYDELDKDVVHYERKERTG